MLILRGFLELKKNHGNELEGHEICFMECGYQIFSWNVQKNQKWSLMCPDECPGLSDCYGRDFVELYEI